MYNGNNGASRRIVKATVVGVCENKEIFAPLKVFESAFSKAALCCDAESELESFASAALLNKKQLT
jgi:hypothetical protein